MLDAISSLIANPTAMGGSTRYNRGKEMLYECRTTALLRQTVPLLTA
jgi:hypothetical protein